MARADEFPEPFRFFERDGVVLEGPRAHLSFYLPPDIGGELEFEGRFRQIPLREIARVAGTFACIGQQIDGYRAVNNEGKVLDAFLVHDPQAVFDDMMVEAIERDEPLAMRGCEDFVVPARLGRKLQEFMDRSDLMLSELMVAGLLDRKEVRRRQAPGVRLDAIKDGEYQVTVVSLT
jgi:hypothetical protein